MYIFVYYKIQGVLQGKKDEQLFIINFFNQI